MFPAAVATLRRKEGLGGGGGMFSAFDPEASEDSSEASHSGDGDLDGGGAVGSAEDSGDDSAGDFASDSAGVSTRGVDACRSARRARKYSAL